MEKEERSRWTGIIIGPMMAIFAVMALWKNEARFDFHKAARRTTAIQSPADANAGQLISHTGPMDQDLSIEGEYVESFTGYLMVRRHAEIYAWDKDEDSDDHVTWDMQWMSHLENNSRNQGIHQQLSSQRFLPDDYAVGALPVQSELIEFVDWEDDIPVSSLMLTHEKLKPEQDFFYLRKGGGDQLGDERVSYDGIPVPAIATYFGKYQSGQGVADQSHRRTGWINAAIQDSGILHYIVGGDRDEALDKMKRYIALVKWIVRGVGTAVLVMGLFIFFSTIFGFLIAIPVIGRIAEAGSFLLALAIGIPFALVAIVSSYLVAHPLLLVILVALIVAGICYLRRRGRDSQAKLKRNLDQRYGHTVGGDEMKDLEFLELAQLALHDSTITVEEDTLLRRWAHKHRWSPDKTDQMINQAKRAYDYPAAEHTTKDHLNTLITLSLADGKLTQYEVSTLRSVAKRLGYDSATISDMINRVRRSASNRS